MVRYAIADTAPECQGAGCQGAGCQGPDARVRMTGMLARIAVLLIGKTIAPRASAAEPSHIYAAGTLTVAFTDTVRELPVPANAVATPVFGPSGMQGERVEHGEPAGLLASADMGQPRTLAREYPGRQVVTFTRNRLGALARCSCCPNEDRRSCFSTDSIRSVSRPSSGIDRSVRRQA